MWMRPTLGAKFPCEQLAAKLQEKVKWFHSGMTDEFQEVEAHALLIDNVYGHAATDATGMVRLFSFLRHSVQWPSHCERKKQEVPSRIRLSETQQDTFLRETH